MVFDFIAEDIVVEGRRTAWERELSTLRIYDQSKFATQGRQANIDALFLFPLTEGYLHSFGQVLRGPESYPRPTQANFLLLKTHPPKRTWSDGLRASPQKQPRGIMLADNISEALFMYSRG